MRLEKFGEKVDQKSYWRRTKTGTGSYTHAELSDLLPGAFYSVGHPDMPQSVQRQGLSGDLPGEGECQIQHHGFPRYAGLSDLLTCISYSVGHLNTPRAALGKIISRNLPGEGKDTAD